MIKDEEYLKDKQRPRVPFPSGGTRKEKILYALSLIMQGSAADVAGRLAEIEGTENVAALEEDVETTLSSLCNEGPVVCRLDEQVMIYNLSEKQ